MLCSRRRSPRLPRFLLRWVVTSVSSVISVISVTAVISVISVILGIATPVLAQSPTSAQAVPTLPTQDLQSLLRNALDRYPSIASRRQEFAAAQSALEGARWQRYPSLSVSGAARVVGGRAH